MRVISQDGTIDIPYELSVIWISEKKWIFSKGKYAQ